MSELKRINKAISETGYCSRREADKLIEQGQVVVNDKKAVSGEQVGPDDVIKVKGKILKSKPPTVYMAFHKPPGITSTTDLRDPDNIIDYIGYNERIFPIGRLDKPSEGLIFMTNDGDIVNKILRAGNNHEKEYVVTVDQPITEAFIKKMSRGVRILGTVTKPCQVIQLKKYVFKITLVQGLNRQIRRMSEVCGYEVKKLVRVRIMNVTLKGIESGKWRYLTKKEINVINEMVKVSSKTEEASEIKGSRPVQKQVNGKGVHKAANKGRSNKRNKPTDVKKSPASSKHGNGNEGKKNKRNTHSTKSRRRSHS